MRILVIGASGKTGRLVVERALAAGYEVTAFVRDPAKLPLRDERLAVVSGDARDPGDLLAALKGREAVISTIGGGERKLMETTTEALVEAMRKAGVRRVVLTSTFLIASNFKPSGLMRLFPRLLKGMTADDRAAVEMLRNSTLDWTIVHPTLLKNKPPTGYRMVGRDETVSGNDRINRADLAKCLLDLLADKGTIGQALVVTGR